MSLFTWRSVKDYLDCCAASIHFLQNPFILSCCIYRVILLYIQGYLAAYTGLFTDIFHTIVNLEWRKGMLYGFARRHLWRRRHGVDCGTSSSWLAPPEVFRGCVHKPPSRCPLFPPKGLVVLVVLRCTGTRHLVFLVSLVDALPHRRVLSDLGTETSLHSHSWLCSGVLRHAKSLLCSLHRPV
jgi:hypothetical protein